MRSIAFCSRKTVTIGLFAATITICGCGPTATDTPSTDNEPAQLRESLAAFNRGAALLEQYLYSKAAEQFEQVLAVNPDWTAARFNLGLAYLNLLTEDSVKMARDAFETILRDDPEHLSARFCLGIYYQYMGEFQNAAECFQHVHRADPEDPYVAYKCAETLRSIERHSEAIEILEKVVERNPGFVSGVYLLATLYMRSQQRDRAMPLFQRFKELNAAELTGGSYVVQSKYGTAGKYYRALGADDLPLPDADLGDTVPIIFSPETRTLAVTPQTWDTRSGTIRLPGLAVADIDADGDLDICLTAVDSEGGTLIMVNNGDGNFTSTERFSQCGVSPCFGDVDNDGDVDLWLGRDGHDQLLLNDGQGQFSMDETELPNESDALTVCARLVDIDSDGDLDLLACRLASGDLPVEPSAVAAASSMFLNNRDGSWQDMAEQLGLAHAEQALIGMLYDDFDSDYDLDLLLLPAEGTPVLWVNDRLGAFRLLDATASGLTVKNVISAVSADPDKDGDRDLLLFCRDGCLLYENQGNGCFQADVRFGNRFAALRGTGGQFADMDNDGDLDLVLADAYRKDGTRGPALLINRWPEGGFVDAGTVDAGCLLGAVRTDGDASCVVADLTGDGRCDILLAAAGQPVTIIENATPGGHWIQFDLVGTRPKDNKARSNNSAIGARVEVKTAGVYQQYMVGGACGPVAMAPLRVHAGLGDNATVDWLRVIWPDAVLQAEMQLPANRVARVEELSRKPSSCPYLFAWDGQRFRFIADFGGVGGLGYLIAPGQYASPDPTEVLPIPGLQSQGDHYVLQALTLLEEITYFDEAKLIAVDHPADTVTYPHEMMAIQVPPPDFELFCFRELIAPAQVVDHEGNDVTQQLASVDRRYAGPTALDARFAGLAQEHFVELDFADRLAGLSTDARTILLAHGWVEYGYSSTNYAASQAGLRTEAPTIQVQRDGRWVTLLDQVGYPAGLNHMMTVDLTGHLQPGDQKLRIISNMELYWDRIVLAQHDDDAELHVTEVAASSADLHFRGYPREFTPDGRHPNSYDYDNLDPSVGWKLMAGDYTRYGDVRPLLDAPDDCFVIMGHGEELTLQFPTAAFGPIPAGYRRSFMLKTDSYCKDMDLYTASPTTVEPLPFHGMSGYPYGSDESYPDNEATRSYRERYNTRRIGSRKLLHDVLVPRN